MINAIKKLLGISPKIDMGELIAGGAVIIDVRTPGEYAGGHLKQSTNVPLNNLQKHLSNFRRRNFHEFYFRAHYRLDGVITTSQCRDGVPTEYV